MEKPAHPCTLSIVDHCTLLVRLGCLVLINHQTCLWCGLSIKLFLRAGLSITTLLYHSRLLDWRAHPGVSEGSNISLPHGGATVALHFHSPSSSSSSTSLTIVVSVCVATMEGPSRACMRSGAGGARPSARAPVRRPSTSVNANRLLP